MKIKLKSHLQWEYLILKSLIIDAEIVDKFFNLMKEDYFNNKECKIIFSIYRKHYDVYSCIPQQDEIVSYINADNKEFNDKDSTLYSLESIINFNISNKSVYIDTVKNFIHRSRIIEAIRESIPIIQNNDFLQVGSITKKIEEAESNLFTEDVGYSPLEDIDGFLQLCKHHNKKISFNLPTTILILFLL